METIEGIFTKIYNTNEWHMGQNETRSGLGSTISWTENIKNEIVNIIKDFNVKKMLDLSCGEWNWMKQISYIFKDDIFYTGLDVVKNIIDTNITKYGSNNINFIHIDMLSYLKSMPDKSFDLVLCRHTLEHLPTKYNIECIEEIKRVSKYALITTLNSCNNSDLNYSSSTYRPINLDLVPYDILFNNILKKYYYDAPISNKYNDTYIIFFSFI